MTHPKDRRPDAPPPELLKRRTFLKAAAGFAGSALLGGVSFRAFAQAAELAPANRCFVFVYFQGGWDQLLALDPRDPAVFTPERLAETRIQPGYDGLDGSYPDRPLIPARRAGAEASRIAFGPAAGRFADHYDRMCVVRGINMTTLSHDVGYRYFLTGKRPVGNGARGSSLATEIVGQMAPSTPIPSLAFGVESYNDGYPGAASALKVNRSSDLLLTLAASKTALDAEIEKQLVDFRGEHVNCEAQLYDRRGLVTTYEQSRAQLRTVLDGKLDARFRFELPANAEVRARYGLPAAGPYDSAGGRAALVATALKGGISQCVSINLAGGLDTHFGSQLVHADNLRAGFNALGDLLEDLRQSAHPAGGNFMDHTTVMVFSEFARTPLLNGSGGRDHHICNSAALLGAGIRHNHVFGRSGDIAMGPGVIDFKTGESAPGGRNIQPEHLIATVLASAKLDYAFTRAEPLTALLT